MMARLKYRNRRTFSALSKRWFDSAAECRYADHLYARQENGEIEGLRYQVKVPLVINDVVLGISLRVDFMYFDKDLGVVVYDEFKGYATREWKLKKKLWAAGAGPGVLRVTYPRKSKVEPYRHDEIWPAGMERSA